MDNRTLKLKQVAAGLMVCVASYAAVSFSHPEVDRIPDYQALPLSSNLVALTSSEMETRAQGAKVVLSQRQQFIAKLLAIFDGPYSDPVKQDAALILGQYRAAEAVPVLIKNLELDEHVGVYVPILGLDEARLKPVAVALETIGMPAFKGLMDKIGSTDDVKLVGKMLSICQAIGGREIVKCRLNGLLDTESEPKKKERLQLALRRIIRF